MKIYYITGYSKHSGKPKYSKATIQQYLSGQIVEAKNEKEETIYLYKSEYINAKK
jgi:hypothetical protein